MSAPVAIDDSLRSLSASVAAAPLSPRALPGAGARPHQRPATHRPATHRPANPLWSVGASLAFHASAVLAATLAWPLVAPMLWAPQESNSTPLIASMSSRGAPDSQATPSESLKIALKVESAEQPTTPDAPRDLPEAVRWSPRKSETIRDAAPLGADPPPETFAAPLAAETAREPPRREAGPPPHAAPPALPRAVADPELRIARVEIAPQSNASAAASASQGVKVDLLPRPRRPFRPAYPAAAIASGMQGRVRLEVTVGVDGRVKAASVRDSSGYPLLDQAALNAIWSMEFEPARRAGLAVEHTFGVPVPFRINVRP